MSENKHHAIKIQSSRFMNSLFAGNFKSAFSWKGIEFQDFREYAPWDDAKYIDWLTSSREWSTVMRRYREDKNTNVLAIIDVRESLDYWNKIKKQLIRRVLDLLYSASRAIGEWLGWYTLDSENTIFTPVRKNPISLEKLKKLSDSPRWIGMQSDFSFLMNPRLKKSVIFILSDSMKIDFKSLKLSSIKHDIIYVYISSYFENTLQGVGISSLRGESRSIGIDLTDEKKKEIYVIKRKAQLQDFTKKLKKNGVDCIYIDENDSISGKFLELMKRRQNIR